ncbi:ABC transporter permease [Streptomyces sp. TRM43335]|uniref:ABC transporter permease n=1 Tax=Streptomyces taklimakanensis TaxID=2569853 RepID=A0A6G2BC35_9ACTN|nr:ABC transporter permease [Streptomyces taklimakanensis]MTE19810.1 ABC transporter permease [Streptomyces taklimakanensis]
MSTTHTASDTTHDTAPGGGATDGAAAVWRRVRALARAELTLLVRNRTALFTALLMPFFMVFLMRSSVGEMNLEDTGLSVAGLVMTSGIAMVLIFVVYTNLIPTYVARREELVLKRLRTGEVRDWEILAGTALPVVVLAVAQCALLVAAGAALLDMAPPERLDLLLAGVLAGVVLMVLTAAVTAVVTRTAESAQITALPLMLASFVGSGLFVPLEVMPDRLADVLRLLPMTPVVDLVRYGWFGGGGYDDVLRALLTAVVWVAASVFAVRRWFRWEPRR